MSASFCNTIKCRFLENICLLKNTICKEKYFLASLLLLTIFFVLSMFFQWAVYISFVLMIAISVAFNFENCLCLFLYSYPYYAIFYVWIKNSIFYLYPFIYAVMFGVATIKYLIMVFKNDKSLDLKLLFPLLLFLIYIILPVHKIVFFDILKYVVAIIAFYLVIIFKKDININALVFYASSGLILSCAFSYLVPLSSRMVDFMLIYTNFHIIKFMGLFTNPNMLAVFASLLLPFLVYNCLQKNGLFWFILLIPILVFAYLTISRDFAVCLTIVLLYFLLYSILKKNKRIAISFSLILLSLLIICVSELNITKAYLVRFNICSEKVIKPDDFTKSRYHDFIFNEFSSQGSNNDQNLWIDGTPIDPGRIGLWERYLKDYTSSAGNIIFGAGISAEPLGKEPHNSYIQFLWQYGLLGTFIALYAFLRIMILLFKDLKSHRANVLTLVLLFIAFIESNMFNHVAIIMLTLFILACGGKYENYSDSTHFQSRKLLK